MYNINVDDMCIIYFHSQIAIYRSFVLSCASRPISKSVRATMYRCVIRM